MGTCGSNEDKGKKNRIKKNNTKPIIDDNGDKKTNGDEEIKEIKEENILNGNKDNKDGEPIKLKGILKNLNLPKRQYKYKLIDISTLEEYIEQIDGDTTIKELLSNKKLRTLGDFIIEFENNIKIGYEKINETFNNILTEIFNKDIPEEIKMNYSYKGLDIPENMDNIINAYIESNKIIGSAILDNDEFFCIITYENDNQIIKPYYYKRKDNEDLIKFNLFTAYCNGNGNLYFSGGENEQTYDPERTVLKYNDFFYIDLNQLNENENKITIHELPNLNEPRTWHSMIYVPYKYIFIVGGSNTKSVEIYNMDSNEIKKDSDLNELRSECTLCLVNNIYLYAFCGFLLHEEFSTTIERCNLLKEERKWEYVQLNENNGLVLKPSFFGISYFINSNEILLIGGNDSGDEKHSDYIYKVGKEEQNDGLEPFQCNLNETNIIFKEKLFMPLENNKSIAFPLIIADDIKFFILDRNTGDISVQNYEQEST